MSFVSRRSILAAGPAFTGALAFGAHPARATASGIQRGWATTAHAQDASSERQITAADIARLPAPGANAPSSVQFTPDGSALTYLFSSTGTLVQELWAYDLKSGREWVLLDAPPESDPSEADFAFPESMRRERLRQYTLGVTDYAWSDSGTTLLARRQSEVLVSSELEGEWRALLGSHDWTDPQLSPDGSKVAFALAAELHVLDLGESRAVPRRLTFDASLPDAYGDQAITNGVAEYVAQEELDRLSGFWWSPDSSRIVFEQADSSAVPRYPILHSGTPTVQVEPHRYPFAGGPNTIPRLGVVPAVGGEVRWLSLGDDPNAYLARVDWMPDGLLAVQMLARDQQHLALRRIDPLTGQGNTLFEEHATPWINVSDDLRFIQKPGAASDDYTILWSSERTGWRELYLYDRDGSQLRQLTDRDAYIDGVAAIDAASGWIAVQGWKATPLEQQFFQVSLDGASVEPLTQKPGTHRCTFSPDKKRFADVFDAVNSPPVATIYDLDGSEVARLQEEAAPDPLLDELELIAPEFVEVPAEDGTLMEAALYRPRNLAPGAKSPVIFNVYGGPVQRVVNSWTMTSDLRPQALTQQGYLVFALDNRGTARRGMEFAATINRNLGAVELRDQVTAVRWLTANVPEADTDRVGIYGWSYGGYLSLMCLARAPEIFKAAAAGAPATNWSEYDSCYTERYMGTPLENPDGYQAASVLTHAGNIRGSLLLIHGLIDENVHTRHVDRLVQEVLIPEDIPYELVAYPEERHHVRREVDRVWLEQAVGAFFQRHL